MGAKVTSRCPKCGHFLRIMEPLRKKQNMGAPFTVCPTCKTILKDGYKKEYINYGVYDIFKWYETRMGGLIFIWTFIATFLSAIIPDFFGFKAGSNEIKMAIIVLFLFFEFVPIYLLYLYNKPEFEVQKNASIMRLKNENYQNVLITLGFCTKKQIDDFLIKY